MVNILSYELIKKYFFSRYMFRNTKINISHRCTILLFDIITL